VTPAEIISAAVTQLLQRAKDARDNGLHGLAISLYEAANHLEWDAPRIPGTGELPLEVSRQISAQHVDRF
jgi:hypothetical protein